MMEKVTVEEAKAISHKTDSACVIVICFSLADDMIQHSSYRKTHLLCNFAHKMADIACEAIKDAIES